MHVNHFRAELFGKKMTTGIYLYLVSFPETEEVETFFGVRQGPVISRHDIDLLHMEYPTASTGGLTHWGRVTHICVGDLTIIGSDNGLSPGRHQAIIWTSAELLLNGTLGTNLTEILIKIITFSFKKMHLKVSSAKWRPFCLCPDVLIDT